MMESNIFIYRQNDIWDISGILEDIISSPFSQWSQQPALYYKGNIECVVGVQ